MFPRHAVLPFLVPFAALCGSCTDAATSVTVPSGERCGVSITNSMETTPAAGGTGTLALSTPRDCTWAASTAAPWIAMTSATRGQGDGSIAYRVAENSDPVARRATIEVNETAVSIDQAAAECRFRVGPQSPEMDAGGGDLRITVETHASCGWSAASHVGWIQVASGASGSGNGAVALSIAANDNAARSGTATIAGALVTVRQEGRSTSPGSPSPPAPPPPTPPPSPPPPAPPSPVCTYAISPTSVGVPAAGGQGATHVTTTPGCAWTAKASDGWIRVTAGSSGTGGGQVAFSVDRNGGRKERKGKITIAGLAFTITQAGEGKGSDHDDDDDDEEDDDDDGDR